jgi:hypothetical protein
MVATAKEEVGDMEPAFKKKPPVLGRFDLTSSPGHKPRGTDAFGKKYCQKYLK